MKNANVDYTLKVRERERAQCIIRVVMFFTFCPCQCFIVVKKGHVTSNNIATIIYSLKKNQSSTVIHCALRFSPQRLHFTFAVALTKPKNNVKTRHVMNKTRTFRTC